MADRISAERRSWNMSRIRGRDTRPEVKVRSILHRLGFRFRLHRNDLPGKPDIVLPGRGAVIFVHGCFWHRHKGCKETTTPKTRTAFWRKKFAGNVERDIKAQRRLRRMGWRVKVIWECQTRDEDKLANRLTRFLERE